ncbi:hypothetical protein BCP47_15765 [Salmonella enterica subsp. enterica serovar Kentucky]|nr:hypothetical protein [Salmonella enterica subsp. enterica serovar Montevideo]ECT7644330.1 hypothetical protein [Salmonella enterica subsp. enterica serovar Kentucky]ECW6007396.1 hypothetical protein [Salmonella enterica subsp. enterica serovar Kentucky]EDC7210459.1 hypothetical protein [Salmonella enterica subsp. enterica serovar Kentucky]
MNKTVYVPSYFQPIYKEVTVKVPTGNTKRFLGFIDIEKKIRKKEVVQEGWSDCQVDGERLNEDITRTVDKLNQDGFEVISITPVTSGNWGFKYDSGSINNGTGRGGYGYGYGYSYTEGVLILAKEKGAY